MGLSGAKAKILIPASRQTSRICGIFQCILVVGGIVNPGTHCDSLIGPRLFSLAFYVPLPDPSLETHPHVTSDH